jgi:AbrB family looped-hinge helix DNA binding protein
MQPKSPEVYRAKVDAAGRVNLPTASRQRFGIRQGDELVIEVDDRGLHVKTTAQVVRQLQDHFTQFTKNGESVVEELLRERREDAAGE